MFLMIFFSIWTLRNTKKATHELRKMRLMWLIQQISFIGPPQYFRFLYRVSRKKSFCECNTLCNVIGENDTAARNRKWYLVFIPKLCFTTATITAPHSSHYNLSVGALVKKWDWKWQVKKPQKTIIWYFFSEEEAGLERHDL